MRVLRCGGCVCCMLVLGLRKDSEPLGALPCVVHCCVFLGPDIFCRVWHEQSGKLFCLDLVRDCFVLSRQKLPVGIVVYISWLHSCLCVWM